MIYAIFSVFPGRPETINLQGVVMAPAVPEKICMGHETYTTLEEAQAQCDNIRRQNLPFRGYPVVVADPRAPHLVRE